MIPVVGETDSRVLNSQIESNLSLHSLYYAEAYNVLAALISA